MNQPIGAPERLAIIGNGFDLKCGLHSTFGEYIKQILKTQDPNGFFLNAYHEMLTNQEFAEDARKLLTNEGIKPTNTSANDMGLLPSTDLDNFWVTVLLLKHEEGNNWADIEAAIGQFLKSPVFTHLLSWSSNRHAVPPVKNDEDKQAIVLISFLSNCLGFPAEKPDFLGFLLSELRRFETSFSNYIADQVNQDAYVYEQKSFKLLSWLTEEKPTSILDFNYTDHSFSRSEAMHVIYDRHIHGSIEDQPIIGIDQSMFPATDRKYEFSKTYRVLDATKRHVDQSVMSHQIKQIVFFGHSLGPADYSYFQSVFDYLNIYENNIEIIFGFAPYGDLSVDEAAHIQESRVAALFDEYGRSMDNQAHGNNLLHKLLLENRLSIHNYKNAEEMSYFEYKKLNGSE